MNSTNNYKIENKFLILISNKRKVECIFFNQNDSPNINWWRNSVEEEVNFNFDDGSYILI